MSHTTQAGTFIASPTDEFLSRDIQALQAAVRLHNNLPFRAADYHDIPVFITDIHGNVPKGGTLTHGKLRPTTLGTFYDTYPHIVIGARKNEKERPFTYQDATAAHELAHADSYFLDDFFYRNPKVLAGFKRRFASSDSPEDRQEQEFLASAQEGYSGPGCFMNRRWLFWRPSGNEDLLHTSCRGSASA